MAKNETEDTRCVMTLPLLTEPWQEHIIEKRFKIVEHLKNQLIGIELRKLKNLRRTKEFRLLEEEIYNTPSDSRNKLYKKRQEMLRNAGFSWVVFKDDMAGKRSKMKEHFVEHIATQIAHKAALDVWNAFNKYLFSTGKEVHYQKKGTLESVACEHVGNGMDYKKEDNIFIWNGGNTKNKIKLRIRVAKPETEYEKEMMRKNLQGLRIVRKWMKNRYKYYLQFTFIGDPVQKERKKGTGRVGIDIGPQTVAISSENQVMLRELADQVNKNHLKKLQFQRKMDRSRRAMNPQNYNPDGTIRRPPRGERMKWAESRKYKLYAGKVRELERKNAAIRKYQHTRLANEVIGLGDQIYVEKMNFAGLQRRAKKTEINEQGRYKKKKRFGKSLANKAPAEFLLILKTKLRQNGGSYQEVDTYRFKASQLDHTSGEYKPAPLSARMKQLSNGDTVQRDLYSSFLLMNSNPELTESNTELCKKTYRNFKILHDIEIMRIRKQQNEHPASFGF